VASKVKLTRNTKEKINRCVLPAHADLHVVLVCRAYRADNKVLLYTGIIQALLAAWAILLSVTANTQPVVACKSLGMQNTLADVYFLPCCVTIPRMCGRLIGL